MKKFFTKQNFMLFLLVLCAFVNALNNSIVANALPIMSKELGVSSKDVNWIVTIFLIITSSTILVFGRLGDLFGNMFVLQSGLLVFSVGSLFCGIAGSFEWLLVARVIQAIGTGAVMANNHGIITKLFPVSERGRALGLNAAFVALGNIAGPSVGGLILSIANWHWLFYILAGVSIILYVLQHILIPDDKHKTTEKIDYLGSGLFIITISLLFYSLQQRILWIFALSIAAFGLFIFREIKCKYRVLDLSLFKNGLFDINLGCACVSYISIQIYNIIIPFYFQDVMLLTAGKSGIYMSLYPVILVCTAPLFGSLSDKIGAQKTTIAGLLLLGIGQFLLSLIKPDYSITTVLIFISIIAFGNGMFQSPNNSLIMSSVPKEKVGIGGSLNALVRNIGQNIGVVMASVLLYSGMSKKAGMTITNYEIGHPDIFIAGMNYVFRVTTVLILIGLIMSLVRSLNIFTKKEKEINYE